jgi:1-aminocyclopropane-1-carboxylate deaminase/D-cysteine desulfhydrase-like pyridoxal-dependent ACC family enzyme
MAIIAAIAAPLVIGGITAAINKEKANNMQNDILNANGAVNDMIDNRQDIYNAAADIRALKGTLSNAYANLGVATKAAEMQQQQTDVALANMMEGMVATGGGAGSATALAQAAAKSKQGISANIEQQESQNQKLKAQGEQQLQQQRMSLEQAAIGAEQQAWQLQEGREVFDINRAQAEADWLRNQQAAYQSAASSALAEGVAGSAQVGAAYAGSGSGN